MNRKFFGLGLTALALAFAATGQALAADPWPTSKPIRIIVPVPPGGAMDVTTRLVALKMSEKLGQQIIIDNRPGGDTTLGTRLVKEAPADGYTILSQSNPFSTQPRLKQNPGYDPLKDFIPLGPMLRGPIIVEVGGGQPDQALKDFIARAKATPLQFASPGIGSAPHIAGELMLVNAGVKAEHIPYKGASAAYPDVVAGRVPIFFDGYAGSAPFLKDGKMRALAVTGPSRIAPLPNVPTLVEQGINVTYTYWLGLIVKAGTPADVVQRLSDSLKYATSSKDLVDRFVADGTDPTFMTPTEFGDYISKEIEQFGKLANDLKLAKE
ncbi:tripartite tricarboxylate transporter substrate-binding protein [Ramlibacter sp. 2FC]|uniref:Bug family tripartite tricarboxylate transporter substrate binding protein n=1 Tax=Ramlibacter sp. 2FC TaxID=2502188 RepID=UPI0010F587B5|nr:tripartite tricarboxylate transporter substrate-binding protein [Ramlibacter sp. 2FC]